MFTERSQEQELLDLGPQYYTHEEYTHCLKQLFRVNQFFGFFRSTVKILQRFPKKSTVLDIGCGGGLFILHLNRFFPDMPMLGRDISVTAIHDAQESLQSWQKKNSNIHVSFQLQAHHELKDASNSFDILLATLVCHHIPDDELVIFLQQAYRIARQAVIINELHRHRLAHWLYGLVSPLLFRNRLITHDGLISIRRGFTRLEWRRLLQRAGIHHFKLKWCFPFRWQLILQK